MENVKKRSQTVRYIGIFLLVLLVGLFYVKWFPYFQKALAASSTHSIGDAIINVGKEAPIFSIESGMTFTIAYFNSVWKAVVLGLIVGSLVQVLIPTQLIKKYLGGSKFRNSVFAMVLGMPTMMCTCCTAPVAVGLKRSQASVNSVVAFFLANPLLNPATLVFMGFVLGWKFTFLRLIFGVIAVLGIATIVSKVSKAKRVHVPDTKMFDPIEETQQGVIVRWIKAFGRLIIESIPAYIVIVFILGAFQGLLFPAVNSGQLNSGIIAIVLFSLVGTLFVIPTAGEIPVIQVLLALGLSSGPAATLLLTLPAVSIVSLSLLKPVFTWKELGIIGSGIILLGIVAGIFGSFIL
ncbi:permease [Enterococcus dongliensis]|uniref:permease n=1 Tax=Enterococcus dongliensis TaxID=2559925 RepID=UPI00288DA18B|nr:permease [Enterococcus dongliensis]MDT2641123.1 permease [Enterococcus dongliensis]